MDLRAPLTASLLMGKALRYVGAGSGEGAMAWGRWMTAGAAAAMLVALPACGKRFPFGENLLPETYGPPFGAALKDNLPEHPHNPAGEERHAAADPEEHRRYASHAACNAAMVRFLGNHSPRHGPVAISSVETLGHYEDHGVVHEYRCSDYVLSYRSWHAEGHGEASAPGH